MTSIASPLAPSAKRSDYRGRTFLGVVADNSDPLQLKRIRVRIEYLMGQEYQTTDLPWIQPRKESAGSSTISGTFSVPDLNSLVYVEFQDDSLDNGFYYGGPATPATAIPLSLVNYPNRYGMVDRRGNHFFVDKQTDDMEILHGPSGTTLQIRANGDILVNGARNVTVAAAQNATVTAVNIALNASNTLTSNATGGMSMLSTGGSAVMTANRIDLNP